MTRTYAGKRLLEHGPLTFREFCQVTGWTRKQSGRTLEQLCKVGGVEMRGHVRGRRLYQIKGAQ